MILKNVNVAYGKKFVLKDFSLEIPTDKITCILGPSGCGKTTLLQTIAGLIPYTGSIENGPKNVSFIFQEPRLIPSLTVEKNIEYVLKEQIKNKTERKKIIKEMLSAVHLEGEEKSYPNELSGGMAQRASLARAFAYPANVLLMDEPFKGLDISLKKIIMELFLALYEKENRTVIFVTHDIDEALLSGDKIVVFTGEQTIETFDVLKSRRERTPSEVADLKEKIYSLL